MRIAFVLSYWQNRFGGPVTVVKSLGPHLAAAGHEVSYWAVGEGEEGDDGLAGTLHLDGHERQRPWRWSKALTRQLSQSARSFDLIHISELWLHPTYAASHIAAAHGIPYILRPDGGLEPWRLRNGVFKRWKKRTHLQLVGRRIMERAACLLAASDQEAEGFRQVGYHGTTTIIPHGVDPDTFRPGDSDAGDPCEPDLKDRPVVLFMSRLSCEKGLDILIPLWADIVKSRPYRDAVLVLAGPDFSGYRRVVERMIASYGIHRHVRLMGMVQGSTKQALLRRADVFVLPSYSENFGMVVAEALACGTPVITTTGTPWQRLETADAGRWVAPTKPALTAAIRQLLDMTPSQRAAMGRRGRALIEAEYTWDKAAARFLHVCDCILGGRPIPLNV